MTKEFRYYFNKKFYKQKDGYWCATVRPIIHAHRWVWININGEIPEGMHIHHIDEDKSNNEIENLQMVTASEHLKIHWKNPDDRAERREFLNEIRPLAHKTMRSPEKRKEASIKAEKGWEKRTPKKDSCQQCKTEYESLTYHQRFCSGKCRRKWNYSNKINFIEEICPVCDKVFMKHKHSPIRFCCIKCGIQNRREK